MILNWLRLVVLMVPAGIAAAQSIEFTATSRGAVFDARDGSLRPLIGVPGSAIVGDPVATGLDAAWAAPNGKYAIGVKDGSAIFFREFEAAPLELLPAPTFVAWNAAGTVAVLYSAGDQTMQCVEPTQAHTPVEVSFLEGAVHAIAVEDCRNIALAKGEHVYLFKDGRVPQIAIEASAVALVFSSDGLYASTCAALLEHRSGVTKAILERADISALAALKTGNLLALSGHTVAVIDRAGTVSHEIHLEQAGDGVNPLGNSTFLLNGLKADQSSAIVLDANAEPSVFFVPAASADSL